MFWSPECYRIQSFLKVLVFTGALMVGSYGQWLNIDYFANEASYLCEEECDKHNPQTIETSFEKKTEVWVVSCMLVTSAEEELPIRYAGVIDYPPENAGLLAA